ncbi:MAG TPA: ATP-binding protein [Candidatus Saccharimonadales bacterium]|nr:ATP-binding protein [Candidatus Saccharimonadales bacterium]
MASVVWYKVYCWWMLAFSGLVGVAYLLLHLVLKSSLNLSALGLSLSLLYIAIINVLYIAFGYPAIKKQNLPLATLIEGMLFSILLFDGLIKSGAHPGSLIYIVGWFGTMVFSGIFGLPFAIGSVFFTLIYIFLTNKFSFMTINSYSWVLVIGSAILSGSFYLFFWRRLYKTNQNQQSGRLNSMLRTNQQQSEIILQSIADGVVVFDTTYKINLLNSSASALTEWPINDALGIDVHSIVKLSKENGEELNKSDDLFARPLNQKKHVVETLKLTGQHGKQVIISLVISPIIIHPNETIVGAVAILRDVTKQRQEEQQRADFISTASHEMRTPVAAIEGYLALALNEKVSSIDSKARSYLDKAHESTQHLGKLFQDLLTSAKAEDGRLSDHPNVVELGELVDQLTDELRFATEKKKLEMQLLTNVATNNTGYIDASTKSHVVRPLYYIYADPERLREVITNLFDNAVKYTSVGKISIGLTGDDNVAQLFVKDTGPGIPAEDLPHLFQKFYRVDNSSTRTVGGTGLGLYICRKIIELYKGRIWAESTVGEGSTFFINLPRLTTQRAEQLKATESPGDRL